MFSFQNKVLHIHNVTADIPEDNQAQAQISTITDKHSRLPIQRHIRGHHLERHGHGPFKLY